MLLAGAAAAAAILLLGLLLYWEWLPDGAIPIGNALIKVLCAALAGFFAARNLSEHACRTGAVAGALFWAFSTAVFSLCLGSFRFTWTLLSDLLLSVTAGAAAAALRVLLRKKRRDAKKDAAP